jgi:transposase-like protein
MGTPQVISDPSCPICKISMVLVFIEPRVASFTELNIFRCFSCGNMRSIEQKTNPHYQAAELRPSFFD